MVEITLPIALQIIQTVSLVVGIIYYITILRNQDKTRQIQLLSQLSKYTQEEFQKKEYQLYALEWNDYDDFEKKYGSDSDLENYAIRYAIWSEHNKIGFILKTGLIDVETLLGYLGGQLSPLWLWNKFESIIREQRRRYKQPDLLVWWEHAAKEIQRYYEMKGHTDIILETMTYIPDE